MKAKKMIALAALILALCGCGTLAAASEDKVMPAARMRAVHQIDVLTRAKARLEELMEADYESD